MRNLWSICLSWTTSEEAVYHKALHLLEVRSCGVRTGLIALGPFADLRVGASGLSSWGCLVGAVCVLLAVEDGLPSAAAGRVLMRELGTHRSRAVSVA